MDDLEIIERFEGGEPLDRILVSTGLDAEDVLEIVHDARLARHRRESIAERAAKPPVYADTPLVPWTPVDRGSPWPRNQRSLRAAVLVQAIHDARCGAADAIAWIDGTANSEVGWSCVELCEVLGLRVAQVRDAVARHIGPAMRPSVHTVQTSRR